MIDTGLKGKTVIVTGANHGIGAAIALAFAREGARVLITFLRQSPELYGETQANVDNATTPGRAYYCREIGQSADLVAETIRSFGGECMTWEADLSNPNMISKLFDQAEKRWGVVDVIVNNAAFAAPDTFLPQLVLDKNSVFSEEYLLNPLSAQTHEKTKLPPNILSDGLDNQKTLRKPLSSLHQTKLSGSRDRCYMSVVVIACDKHRSWLFYYQNVLPGVAGGVSARQPTGKTMALENQETSGL